MSQLVESPSRVSSLLTLGTVSLARSWCFILETEDNKCTIRKGRKFFSGVRDFFNVEGKWPLSFEALKPLDIWVSGQWVGQLDLSLGSGTRAYCICIRRSKNHLDFSLKYGSWILWMQLSMLYVFKYVMHSSIAVLKYKRNDEEESLKDKLSKLNIHSISKKSKRVTNHLKILTRGEPQVIFLL